MNNSSQNVLEKFWFIMTILFYFIITFLNIFVNIRVDQLFIADVGIKTF